MKYTIKSRIWIELDDSVLLGEGRVELLKLIGETGSLSKAAKGMNMSYKKAWRLLDTMNKAGTRQVVETSVGGKDGGGAVLTTYGQELITAFTTINQNCWEFLDSQIQQLPKK